MKVRDVMSKHVQSVGPTTPLRDLWKAIFKKHIHALPVVDREKKMIGIVVEEDLLTPLYPGYEGVIEDFVGASDFEQMEEKIHDLVKLKASDVMNKRIIFTRDDSPVLRALSRMLVHKVHQLPVVTEENVLIGIVTKGDIFDSLFKKHLRLRGFSKNKLASLRRHIPRSRKK